MIFPFHGCCQCRKNFIREKVCFSPSPCFWKSVENCALQQIRCLKRHGRRRVFESRCLYQLCSFRVRCFRPAVCSELVLFSFPCSVSQFNAVAPWKPQRRSRSKKLKSNIFKEIPPKKKSYEENSRFPRSGIDFSVRLVSVSIRAVFFFLCVCLLCLEKKGFEKIFLLIYIPVHTQTHAHTQVVTILQPHCVFFLSLLPVCSSKPNSKKQRRSEKKCAIKQ